MSKSEENENENKLWSKIFESMSWNKNFVVDKKTNILYIIDMTCDDHKAPTIYPYFMNYCCKSIKALATIKIKVPSTFRGLHRYSLSYDSKNRKCWIYDHYDKILELKMNGKIKMYDNIYGHQERNKDNLCMFMINGKLNMIGGQTLNHYVIIGKFATEQFFLSTTGRQVWTGIGHAVNREGNTCYLVGGADGRKNQLAYEQVFVYESDNTKEDRWDELIEMKEGIQSAGCELLGDEQEYLAVFGGIKTNKKPTSDIQILDMNKKRWIKCPITLPFAGDCKVFVMNKQRDNELVHGYAKEIEKKHNLNIPYCLKEIVYKFQKERVIHVMSDQNRVNFCISEIQILSACGL